MARPRKVIPSGDFQPDVINRKARFTDQGSGAMQTSAPDPVIAQKKTELNTAKILAKKNSDEYEKKTSGKNPQISKELRQKQIDTEQADYNYNNARMNKAKKRKEKY